MLGPQRALAPAATAAVSRRLRLHLFQRPYSSHHTTDTVVRRAGVGDRVVLAEGISEAKGLRRGDVATVIKLHPKGRLEFFYRIELADSYAKPWLGLHQLTLLDPLAPRPRPTEPESNECSGSDCPNCVWISYWDACEAFELQEKEAPQLP